MAATATGRAGFRDRLARGLTFATLSVALLAVPFAHVSFVRGAGGLWRDEANSAAFASMSSLGEIASSLRHDSVPLASTLLFWFWSTIGLGSDAGLRALGGLIGLGLAGALVLSARATRAPLPLVSLVLVGLNAWVIRGGDAVRPTGLGMLTAVLAYAALGRALERPRLQSVLLAAVAAVLSVQTLYANAPLVGAMTLAGVLAGALERSRPRMAIAAGVGIVAALSLLPYLPVVAAAREWGVLVQSRADFSRAWEALRSTAAWDGVLWPLIGGAGLAGGAVSIVRARDGRDGDERRRALYAAVTLLGGIGALAGFLAWGRLATQPWYYLPAMALAAAALDTLLGPALRAPRPRALACLAALVATGLHAVAIGPRVSIRQTNVDLVAARVAAEAAEGDLVVVHPWFVGVSFHRYYHGSAAWTTIPPLEDSRVHRYDLVLRRMREPVTGDSVAGAIARTFAAGHRVWLVGLLPPVEPGESPPLPEPAPSAALGWNSDLYGEAWARRAVATLMPRLRSAEAVAIRVPGGTPVSAYEDVPLFLLAGRPAPGSTPEAAPATASRSGSPDGS